MRVATFLFFIFFAGHVSAQQEDSTDFPLHKVKVGNGKTMFRMPSSENTVDRQMLDQQNPYSMVAAINSVPGARMEERSPGSYRLSIRGSLLRSPFGVRNVKIYLGEFPFTDAGGNTYLNSLDISNINSLRILKGPEASIFGANTGGVLLIDPVRPNTDSSRVAVGLGAGSYGLLSQNIWFGKQFKNSVMTISQAFQQSQGYRENSSMRRHYLQVSELWNYSSKASLNFFVLFSDLYYHTPGGLNQQQFKQDPRKARPATATLPGAAEQKASVQNRTIFGGVTHNLDISRQLKYVLSVFGSGTDFKNPFITNYEQRKEQSYGVRTYLDLKHDFRMANARFNIGAEWQQTNSAIDNYGNKLGVRDTMQASDKLKAQQGFLFSRLLLDIHSRLLLEVSASYNFFNYRYKNNYPVGTGFHQKKFDPQLMPRISVSYLINDHFAWRASASAGYSTPTIAEVRASDNIVNTNLQAEKASSFETGFRLRNRKENILFDVCAFYYELKNAIVRRTDSNNNEYFMNAGGTRQPGLEAQLELNIIKARKTGWIRSLLLKGNMTYYDFSFDNYVVNKTDYSGKKLTGVPDYTSTESISVGFPANFNLFAQYYYVKNIPLDDANTVYAEEYHLVQVKGQWKKSFKKMELILFAGIDNLLDQKYSLGNDLNAAGGRYYNAAAPRNYYGGLRLEF